MRLPLTAISFISILSIAGCAGSASHKVVKNDPVADQSLTCEQAEAEIIRAQSIINEVNEDKADVSGADVMDTVLWFPFNLMVKSSNYNSALTAANQRIIAMKQLRQEKGCPERSDASQDAEINKLSARIRELNKLYKDGQISEEEYMKLKQEALDSISMP